MVAPLRSLLSREHWLEIARILITGAAALSYWRGVLLLPGLLGAVALGVYPLVRSGIRGLVRERRVGTEVFIVVATVVASDGPGR